MLDKQFIM